LACGILPSFPFLPARELAAVEGAAAAAAAAHPLLVPFVLLLTRFFFLRRGVFEARQKCIDCHGLVEPYSRGRRIFFVCIAFGTIQILIVDETRRVVQTTLPREGTWPLAEDGACL
jgi:hypothetical protein